MWRLDLLLGLLAVQAAYLLVARRKPWSGLATVRAFSFGLGLLALYLAQGSPLHTLGERYLFSAHMGQHTLLSLVMAPLLLLGLPPWLVRPVLALPGVRTVAPVLFHPLTGLLSFNLAFSLYHVPAIYQAGLRFGPLHFAQHALLVCTALLMWWPVASPLPERRLGEGAQILYLFAQGVAQLLVFAMVTYADHVLYPWYAGAPRVARWLSAQEDQALAGFIMNVGGLAVFLPAILLVLVRWVRRETFRYPLYPDPPGQRRKRR